MLITPNLFVACLLEKVAGEGRIMLETSCICKKNRTLTKTAAILNVAESNQAIPNSFCLQAVTNTRELPGKPCHVLVPGQAECSALSLLGAVTSTFSPELNV